MTFWVAGAVVGSALIGSKASSKAASAQAAAAEQSGDQQRAMFERQVELSTPYREAGELALNKLVPLATEYTPFGMQQFQTDPGYAFRLSEGQKALDRQAAARGGLISGGALKAAQRYGQEMGSQEYTNAYNRFRDTQSLRRNALAGVAGYGPTAAGSMSTAGQNYATSAGNAMTQQGVNTGNALLASQQAQSSSYGQLGSVLGKYLGSSGSSGIGTVGTTAGYYDTSGAQF